MAHATNVNDQGPSWYVRIRGAVRAIGQSPGRIALFALIVNIILFRLFVRHATPCYETNDDAAMMMIASGIWTGEPSEFLIFTNVLIGRVLTALYHQTQEFNWYACYLYLSHFAAMTALLYAFLRRRFSLLAMLLFLLIFVSFELRMLLLLQFTTCAAVVATSGLLLILGAATGTRRLFITEATLGILLLVLSAMIRHYSIILILLVALPLILYEFRRQRKARSILALVTGVFLAWCVVSYDHHVYNESPAWRDFQEYNSARGRLHGFSILRYNDETQPFYDEIGWSENDLLAFSNWIYADRDVHSKDRLERIVGEFGRSVTPWEEWFPYLVREMQYSPPYLGIVLLAFVSVLVPPTANRTPRFLAGVATFCLIAGVFIALAMLGRVPERVTICALYLSTVTLFYLLTAPPTSMTPSSRWRRLTLFGYQLQVRFLFRLTAAKYRDSDLRRARRLFAFRRTGPLYLRDVVLVAFFLGCIVGISAMTRELVTIQAQNRINQSAFEQILTKLEVIAVGREERPVYVLNGGILPYRWQSPFTDARDLRRPQFVALGWMTHSPHYHAMLKRYGMDDLYKNLYERKDVLYVSDRGSHPFLIKYYEEHLNEEICVVELARIAPPPNSRASPINVAKLQPCDQPTE